MPERPPGDPRELLRIWMEWEQGDTTPGRVMADLKRAGLRELLDGLAEQLAAAGDDAPGSDG